MYCVYTVHMHVYICIQSYDPSIRCDEEDLLQSPMGRLHVARADGTYSE